MPFKLFDIIGLSALGITAYGVTKAIAERDYALLIALIFCMIIGWFGSPYVIGLFK